MNLILAILKLSVGVLSGSAALLADGFNSAGDIIATVVAFAGYRYARKPPDDDHHFGHRNAENVAGLVVGGMLLATGIFIAIQGGLALIARRSEAPDRMALWAACFTIVVKELLYRYTLRVGREISSHSLLASARDHRADVIVAFTVFAGIFAARLSVPWLDPATAMLVGLYITYFACEPIKVNIAILMDQAPEGLREEIAELVLRESSVLAVDQVRVHPLGAEFIVDMEISVSGALSLSDSHEIAHEVADKVCASFAHVEEVKVHVNPAAN